MLQIKQICKEYKTGGLVQKALDGVSLNLRENEFVAILGPSGSGKTTLLNIIGGLDRYDSGDLIINGISTKKYTDRDWDSYRNHTIGFVFQSYNLIPHQNVLSNVELALTISGISREERRERAAKALQQVGLGEQLHKKPNQMSGGQMQRVAIARALVNDPDILLADEPTGALDSETSVQVMELLKEVAKDRLVVMVTHNPELAEAYATRIVNLKDGKIRSDSNPYEIEETGLDTPVHKNMGKSAMSFLTALSLSFHNLWTKKARTLLTAFAGSIGIIGISLILSLSNGVNEYIRSVEEETLSEYPLQIQSSGMDLSAMMSEGPVAAGKQESDSGDVHVIQMVSTMFSTVNSNDLQSLKEYFDSGESGIEEYAKAVEYSYNVSPQIYRTDGDSVRQVHPDQSFSALGIGSASSANSIMSMAMSTDVFYEMPEDEDLYEGQYEVMAGRWPENYNECVVVLTASGNISDFMLYTLGLRDSTELDEMIERFTKEETPEMPENMGAYDYEDFVGISFKLINGADCYEYDDTYHVWKDKTGDESFVKKLVNGGEDIEIVGVVKPAEGSNASMLNIGIGYPASLTRHVIEQAADSKIVQAQLEEPGTNVITGNTFGEENKQNGFDMSSMFTINEEAFANAFQFNSGSFNLDMTELLSLDMGTMGFSDSIDLGSISLDLPELSGVNMGDIMKKLDVTVYPENIAPLVSNILEGYQEYAQAHPEADYSKLSEYFFDYLNTEAAQQILKEHIENIIAENGNITVSPENLQALVQDIMAGYGEYAKANNLTDPDKFGEYLLMYLQTEEAQQKIASGASKVIQIDGKIGISTEQLEDLAKDLAEGYQQYTVANALPDPSKMGEYFLDYLQTDAAQAQLYEGIAKIIDVEALETQISETFQDYMQTTMDAYTGVISQALETQITAVMQQVVGQLSQSMAGAFSQAMTQMGTQLENAFQIDTDAFGNAIQMNMDEKELAELMSSLMYSEDTSYDSNMKKFGYADLDKPGEINIYPRDFESKAAILDILDDYNSRMEEAGEDDKVISYTDLVGTLMSSVTDIVDIISYVLVAFVAISLIVSSIMIGVITYISVLERKKEIGILRAMGASKRNISQVFNAETIIIGLCAGVIGIGLTLLILIPGNALIHHLTGEPNINAALPPMAGLILILLSMLLTSLGGLIPSKKAAKSDPVTALRTE